MSSERGLAGAASGLKTLVIDIGGTGIKAVVLSEAGEPTQRRIVFQRGLNYFRGQVHKAAGDDDDGNPETTETEEEIKRMINRRIKRSGKAGLRMEYLNDLIQQHGALRIARILRDMGTRFRYKAGRLWLDDPTATAHQGAKRGLHRSMPEPERLILQKAAPEKYVIRAPDSPSPRFSCRATKKES